MAEGRLHDHGDGEIHEHPGMEEDVELSVRAKRLLAMEELLVEKGVIGGDDVRRLLDVVEARSPVDGARVVARPGSTRTTAAVCWRSPRRPSPSLDTRSSAARSWRSSRTPTGFTTSSSAPSAPATRRRCSACRPTGTRASPTGRGPWWIRGE